ncbi:MULTISPECIES: IclR family transcriptional regulator [Paenibacillus]|uniref:IclR family transcriptional regulator n=1 Tax=Paenibacillus naphthalenovorans TaxID=162209 RepID=A0A0U2VPG3_9BACL|nr:MULTISPECIES: IclR family transcriptional regulator [Paenibacillus]ALS21415.1 IclR family transcriptional regulator [Paenibacillus naphthalenovorans]NTZ18413.1 IclR family transcriptional regulator [Paenibacillus sp. JMULE4]GCL72675.1 IclR family transcriptional regulator [Paenibacillus naphthalenovorans]SDJ54295.1 IclR family transcriptional regulator, KDG regulon repressor [Paenibacillus naphthalenovorans]
METAKSSYGNVAHALDILLAFKDKSELSLVEMSELLKIRKSYLLKILDGLKEKQFITQDSSTGNYQLGLACLELGYAFEKRLDIRKVTHPSLVELAKVTNELVHLGVLDANVVVLLDRVVSNDSSLRLQFHLSLTSPPYSTALGKVLLAFSDEAKVEHYLSTTKLEPYTSHTTVDPNIFRLELAQIRKLGYYLSYETFENGISCLSAPVFSRNGSIAAAISICAPTIRIMSKEKELVKHLLETTSKVSAKLGYAPMEVTS